MNKTIHAIRPATSARAPDDYTIGDLAHEFDVTLRALRFYESRGLLNPKRAGLTRFYDAENRERLALILKGKALGFTLQEIREMIFAKDNAGKPSRALNLTQQQVEEQLEMLLKQKAEIEAAILELKTTRQRLIASKG